MERIYEDIAKRTGGDIYLGVVGPVRTGKSTFIKRFMETLVLPNMEDSVVRERARDELPQSGSGRTIMTAEPKFVPENAVEIQLPGGAAFNVRMVDSVGYMVPGAIGQYEDGRPRMVVTPWYDYEIPMTEAAEIGTKKVINEHSTIGLVVTTDGTITELPREEYREAEQRVIEELKLLNKPFIVLVNSLYPDSVTAQAVCDEILQSFGVSAIAANCQHLEEDDIRDLLKAVLYEFPVSELGVDLPAWVETLAFDHPLKAAIFGDIRESGAKLYKIRDIQGVIDDLRDGQNITGAQSQFINLGTGVARIALELPRELFYKTLGEQSGFEINDDGDLMRLLSGLSRVKDEYDKVENALREVRENGYGIVLPSPNELTLEEPEIVKQGGQYGVRLRASAPSIHMIRADIQTEVSPIIGNEKQSEDLIHYMLSEFDDQPDKIWQSNIFGKSLYDLVSEGLNNKLKKMPDDARHKLRETLQRIINEGSGGLICIIL
ncbi:stage IV sporulation protein A [Clostridia bacterium]|nr:stage IV sporulation protein A [Clostridia bacterium]